MASVDYIIVGRDIGQARYHKVGDEYLEASTDPGGTPMDVVQIGKLIARMSERQSPNRKPTADELEQIRRCLTVETIPPNQFTLNEKEAILNRTTVKVLFEERQEGPTQTADTNTRYLVIPADGTIQTALDKLAMPSAGNAFEPPLTYPIDEKLMLGYLTDQITEMVVAAEKPADLDHMDWTGIRKYLADHLEDRLSKFSQNAMVDQLTAYHRAVGIYATNMCR